MGLPRFCWYLAMPPAAACQALTRPFQMILYWTKNSARDAQTMIMTPGHRSQYLGDGVAEVMVFVLML